MDELNVDFRVAVLTVPDIVANEEFPRWLRREILAIQETCTSNSFAIVRLFLPSRVRDHFSHASIDKLLQSLADKHKNIRRVELVVVDEPLNMDEMEIIRTEAEKELADVLESVARIQQQKNERSRLH
jgi:hypothetical protein